jgi:monooxygenase
VSEFEHLDVLIVGAGLSGIGAACRIEETNPEATYAILEARDAIGGTWDLFRYPGVRSDSDMFTLSYPFRPWTRPEAMADGAHIRDYIRETAAESGVEKQIRFGTRVLAASWSTADARWTVRVANGAGEQTLTCGFLHVCAGYYDYSTGHQPQWPGLAEFRGTLVHPQFWPEDLDYDGKRVVVIGSGATAVTLVPSMTDRAAHVTMLQRSPGYLVEQPWGDPVADLARRLLPAGLAHRVARTKNMLVSQGFYQLCRRRPALARRILRAGILRRLPDAAFVDEHFTPRYDPWDQRLCVVPGGDFLRAVRAGTASVVTDHVERFTPTGIRLRSGKEIAADVVVSATGLRLLALGGIAVEVDGERVDLADTVAYRGFMLSGVPNMALCVGYVNASWTLRADLTAQYVCRVLRHMRDRGLAVVTAPEPPTPQRRPLLDLSSGYVRRSMDAFPRQGTVGAWRMRQNYVLDRLDARRADLTRELEFAPAGTPTAAGAPSRTADVEH